MASLFGGPSSRGYTLSVFSFFSCNNLSTILQQADKSAPQQHRSRAPTHSQQPSKHIRQLIHRHPMKFFKLFRSRKHSQESVIINDGPMDGIDGACVGMRLGGWCGGVGSTSMKSCVKPV